MRRVKVTTIDRGEYRLTGCDGTTARVFCLGYNRVHGTRWQLADVPDLPAYQYFDTKKEAINWFGRNKVGSCPSAPRRRSRRSAKSADASTPSSSAARTDAGDAPSTVRPSGRSAS